MSGSTELAEVSSLRSGGRQTWFLRVSASSHKWEAYRRRRFGRFSRRERRAYLDPYVRSEQRRKSAKAPSALRVGLKRVRLRRCSFVTYCSGYAPHSRLAS